MEVYMDHSATTYVLKEVKNEMDKYFDKEYANPGSVHSKGFKAKDALKKAREIFKKALNADSTKEIIFTGSGTESVNLAIKGVARKNKGKHIITSKTEHHAVLNTCKDLEKHEGYEVTYLDVDKYGLVNPEDVKKAIRKDTVLITIMYVNNEIGTINPIKEIGSIAKQNKVYFHTDACQATCYLDLDVKKLNVDLMTLNSSKTYGPKGVGMLYVKKGTNISPMITGGGQEFGLRAGTENVPGIVGFAKALEITEKEKVKESKRLTELRDYMIKKILNEIPDTLLNGHPKKRLPNNVNVTFLNIEGESILLHLDVHKIYASTGSACTSNILEPSHVILALGLPHEAAHGSIRFSLGKVNNKTQVDYVIKHLKKIVKDLRSISPVELKLKDLKVRKK